MSKHTGGKWEAINEKAEDITYVTSDQAGTGDICDLYHTKHRGEDFYRKENAEANARRIVACVNALDRFSNEALDGGVVDEMTVFIKALDSWDRERNTFLGDPFRKLIGSANAILAKLKEGK